MTHIELREMLEGAGLYLDNGEMFGPLGRGFQRINLACAKVTIEKALLRFKNAVEEVRRIWEEKGKPYHKTLTVGDKLEGFTYTSADGTEKTLDGNRKTFIVFSRFYDCELCKVLLTSFTASYPVFKAMGYDIKFIMQNEAYTLEANRKKYPFELIADPKFELYDKYNVFEADGIVNMLAGDKIIELVIGKNVYKLLNLDMIESINSALAPAEQTEGPRENQLCAFVAVDKDMTVTYAHYAKTMTDFPAVKDIIKILKK